LTSHHQSKLIRQAFEFTVAPIGDRSKALLIEDLKYQGVYLDDPELDLEKLVNGLREILRNEPAELIIERMLIKLDEIESTHS
jgi:hypothetical protein